MRHNGQDPYASEAQTKALLRFGAQYRLQRIQAADMILENAVDRFKTAGNPDVS